LLFFIIFFFHLNSSEDAVCLGKVHCTFWSLGESLKPGGSVNPFVVSAFGYLLFLKPSGQPDVSKCHYFFANTGVNSIFLHIFYTAFSSSVIIFLIGFFKTVLISLVYLGKSIEGYR